MPENVPYLFELITPLGFSVHTTATYWALIQGKHPEVVDQQEAAKDCIRLPDQIRQSKQDKTVYLFYRPRPPYHMCVVVKRTNNIGFVVTCYLTDKIKEGEKIWPTSE
jgi:hypothetical protein